MASSGSLPSGTGRAAALFQSLCVSPGALRVQFFNRKTHDISGFPAHAPATSKLCVGSRLVEANDRVELIADPSGAFPTRLAIPWRGLMQNGSAIEESGGVREVQRPLGEPLKSLKMELESPGGKLDQFLVAQRKRAALRPPFASQRPRPQ
jgi:hypothetical protein